MNVTERAGELIGRVARQSWRPLIAAAMIEIGTAAMPDPVFANPLNRPQAVVVEVPSLDFNSANLPPSAINIEKDSRKISELTVSMIADLNDFFPDVESRVDALGYRISNAWVGQDNFRYIAFQRAIIQKGPDNRLYLWNTLDNMSDFGMDTALDDGSFGVTIPAKRQFQDRATTLEGIFSERAELLNMPADILEFAQATRRVLEIGVPTGYRNYGPYSVWRFQRLAIMKWADGPQKGIIQGILAGDAANAAGLIPIDVALASPDLGSGGPSTTDIIRPEGKAIKVENTLLGGEITVQSDPEAPGYIIPLRPAEVKALASKYRPQRKDIHVEFVEPVSPNNPFYRGIELGGGTIRSIGVSISYYTGFKKDDTKLNIYIAIANDPEQGYPGVKTFNSLDDSQLRRFSFILSREIAISIANDGPEWGGVREGSDLDPEVGYFGVESERMPDPAFNFVRK